MIHKVAQEDSENIRISVARKLREMRKSRKNGFHVADIEQVNSKIGQFHRFTLLSLIVQGVWVALVFAYLLYKAFI